jgi:hypothetical protein
MECFEFKWHRKKFWSTQKNNVIEQGKSEILLLDLQLQREYVKLF